MENKALRFYFDEAGVIVKEEEFAGKDNEFVTHDGITIEVSDLCLVCGRPPIDGRHVYSEHDNNLLGVCCKKCARHLDSDKFMDEREKVYYLIDGELTER